MRDWFSLLIPVVAVFAAVPLLAYVGQERLLFFPQPLSDERANALLRAAPDVASVGFTAADGTPLHAWLLPARGDGAAPLVLYFGGNAEDVTGMLAEVRHRPEPWARQLAWLFVDYRGYGRSLGKPGERELVADAIAAHDVATARADVDRGRVYAFGRSLGSGVAVQLAAQRPLAGLALVTSFDSAVAVGKRHYPFLPVGLLLRHRFDSIAIAPKLTVPALFVAAEHDDVVPPAHARRLHDAWGGRRIWRQLPGVGHNDLDASPQFWPALAELLAPPSTR